MNGDLKWEKIVELTNNEKISREYASSTIFDNKKYISELDDKILLEKSLMS